MVGACWPDSVRLLWNHMFTGNLDAFFAGAECPGEPLNVIISAQSDPYILTTKGLLEYIRTLGLYVLAISELDTHSDHIS